MSKSIVFLTTSDIFHLFWMGEEDVQVTTLSSGESVYSTGKLEKLLAEGKRPVVISSRSKLGEHDAWWRKLLPESDVHCVLMDRNEDGGSFTALCKQVVEQVYGLAWPMEPVSKWREEPEPMFWTNAFREINKQQEQEQK